MEYNFNERLSSTQIIDIGKHLGLKIRVYARDAIPNKLTNGFYVINLDSKGGSGTHWTCFVKQGKHIIYMDSFGMPPPMEELNVFHKEHDLVYYNKQQIQNLESILCGYFCIAFLYFCKLHSHNHPQVILQGFNNCFAKNTKLNDEKLKKYLNDI